MGLLDGDTQRVVGNNILQAAQGAARTAVGFLLELEASQEVWPHNFVEGLFVESIINDDSEIRFKIKYFDLVCTILFKIGENELRRIMRRTSVKVKNGQRKSSWNESEDRDNVVSILRKHAENSDIDIEVVEDLVNALKKVDYTGTD